MHARPSVTAASSRSPPRAILRPHLGARLEPQRIAYETARLRLARYRLESEQSRLEGAAHATRVSAEALQVERVGVWLFKDRGSCLVCVSLYQRSLARHSAGQELLMAASPTYARALQERRVIAAAAARSHQYTHELADSYLVPNGITSTLDAPIIQRGQVIGVVRHEHVGEPREWTDRELGFASSVADMVTLVFEQADRLELEAALQERTEQRLEQQKMEALGRMACAVAHDFNNVLATVTHLTQKPEPIELPDDATLDPTLEAAIRSCLAKQASARPAGAASLGAPLDRSALARAWTERDARAWWSAHQDAVADMQATLPPSSRRTLVLPLRTPPI